VIPGIGLDARLERADLGHHRRRGVAAPAAASGVAASDRVARARIRPPRPRLRAPVAVVRLEHPDADEDANANAHEVDEVLALHAGRLAEGSAVVKARRPACYHRLDRDVRSPKRADEATRTCMASIGRAPRGTRSVRRGPVHGEQVFRWIYRRGVLDPADGPTSRAAPLAPRDAVLVDRGRITGRAEAADGRSSCASPSRRSRGRIGVPRPVRAHHALHLESGRLRARLRLLLTGKMGLVRHLRPGEIVGQVALLRETLELGDRPLSVVFMGMGEPLHNYDATLGAVRLLADPAGFVSRGGASPSPRRASSPRSSAWRGAAAAALAVSLNATTDEVRDRIMP